MTSWVTYKIDAGYAKPVVLMAKLNKHVSLCNLTFFSCGVFSQLFSPIVCLNASFLLLRSVTPCESQESLELLYSLVKYWVYGHFHGQKLYFCLFLWGSQEEAACQIVLFFVIYPGFVKQIKDPTPKYKTQLEKHPSKTNRQKTLPSYTTILQD